MTPLKDGPEIFGIITKAVKFENGAFLVAGAAAGAPFTEFLQLLFLGIQTKTWAMPFVIAAISFVIYLLAYVLDFITGLRAAKFEAKGNPDYIKSDKLWSSIYKLLAIQIIMFGLCFFALVFALLEVGWVYNFFLYAIAAVGFMAFLFDMHSVGENHKRRFKTKPALFEWLDDRAKDINEAFSSKIKNIFK